MSVPTPVPDLDELRVALKHAIQSMDAALPTLRKHDIPSWSKIKTSREALTAQLIALTETQPIDLGLHRPAPDRLDE